MKQSFRGHTHNVQCLHNKSLWQPFYSINSIALVSFSVESKSLGHGFARHAAQFLCGNRARKPRAVLTYGQHV